MSDTLNKVQEIKDKVIAGGAITDEEAMWLANEADHEELFEAAAQITKHFGKPEFNPCGIINARAGKCSENCKWCAQSAHYATGARVSDIVSSKQVVAAAQYDEAKGVKRFCQVTSGRSLDKKALQQICDNYRELRKQTGLFLCGSLGLLKSDDLQQLWDAGMRRLHCNLETAPSYFDKLCSTHTIDDKLETLKAARKIGFELCSGGIIGMGESRAQRIELGLKLREINPDSIPINVLVPIKGTPLADVEPISEEEVLITIAVFRFIHPKAELRFAGGRAQLSADTQRKALHIGINSAVVGDLLTTVGATIDADMRMASEEGYVVDKPKCHKCCGNA
jgi:biotin synthase